MNYPFYKKLGYVGIRQDKDLVFFKKDRNNNYDKLWSRQIARRDVFSNHVRCVLSISTHTPLARRDDICKTFLSEIKNFYSHASHEA